MRRRQQFVCSAGEIIGMFGDTMLSGATDPDFNLAARTSSAAHVAVP